MPAPTPYPLARRSCIIVRMEGSSDPSPPGPHEGAAPRAERRRGRLLGRLAALSLAFVLLASLAVAAEMVFRWRADALGFDKLRCLNARDYVCRGWAAGFVGHPYTVFRHPQGLDGVNADGFKDVDWQLGHRTGVPRILCLGGSTTEGGNSMGLKGSFPYLLGLLLQDRLGVPIEVMNAGMSGWNSAEMTTAWFLNLIDYRPDLIVIHEAVNDVEPRNHPGFRRDYAHYRHAFVPEHFSLVSRWLARYSDLWVWLLARKGPPTVNDLTVNPRNGSYAFDGSAFPPEVLLPYRRNLESIGISAESYGGTLAFMTLLYDPASDEGDPKKSPQWRAGIKDSNRVMRELAGERGWMLCDLASLEQDDKDWWKPHFLDLVHVDPLGNLRKAERLADALLEQGFFQRWREAHLRADGGGGEPGEPQR